MEINLAILIMAGGVLSVLGLYSLGYRENRQSQDDVASAAYADAVISPLVMALSSTNLKWSAFNKITDTPAGGWSGYVRQSDGKVDENPEELAGRAYGNAMPDTDSLPEIQSGEGKFPSPDRFADLKPGLVVLRDENSAVVRIGFRAARNPADLLAMPLYYTEVRFQGVVDQ